MGKASEAQRRHWEETLAAWRRSGEPLSSWARRRGVSRDALEYWKRRLPGESPGTGRGKATALKLIPVAAAAPLAPTGGALELAIGRDGWRIVVPADFDAAALARLLDVVDARC